MRIRFARPALLGALCAAAAACASFSPASRIENRLIDLGMSPRGAECLANELNESLDRKDLVDIADFLDRLDRPTSSRGAFDTLRSVDNPRAAASVAAAGIFCALGV